LTIEREVKLGVWPGFTMPALDDLAEDVVADRGSEQRLDAVYHDTADLRLARSNITLRYRTGDDEGDGWTLKLPKSATKGLLSRDEIVVVDDPRVVPDEISRLVVAEVRGAPVLPIARLHTVRQRVVLRTEEGKHLAEVVDDEVSVLDGRRVALRFREVEVELAEGVDEEMLDEIVVRLRAAGAGQPDTMPKVIRALGPRALEPPDLQRVVLGKRPTAAEVLRAGLTKAALRVLDHDAGVRVGEEPEAVHQARVGTRRLRSDLRTFGPLLDREWAEELRVELAWLADLLGAVRDTDVLLERLDHDVALLDDADARGARVLGTKLRKQRTAARGRLLGAMDSARYTALLDRLVDASLDPKVLPDAARPAADVLPALVDKPWRALAKAASHVEDDAPDEVLHRIRIRAKRARYAADVAALVLGKPAARFAEAVAGVQEVLGDHQDACVLRAWLRDAAVDLEPGAALAAGQLLAMASARADDRRAAWSKAWAHANKGRLRTWLTH
jgi:CHAD domain-containing protein